MLNHHQVRNNRKLRKNLSEAYGHVFTGVKEHRKVVFLFIYLEQMFALVYVCFLSHFLLRKTHSDQSCQYLRNSFGSCIVSTSCNHWALLGSCFPLWQVLSTAIPLFTLLSHNRPARFHQTTAHNGASVLEFCFVCVSHSVLQRSWKKDKKLIPIYWPSESEFSSEKPWASAFSYTFDNFLFLFGTLINQIVAILDWVWSYFFPGVPLFFLSFCSPFQDRPQCYPPTFTLSI